MATLTREQVQQIIDTRPDGASPEGIIAAIREQGHTIEGFPEGGDPKVTFKFQTEEFLNPPSFLEQAGEVLTGAAKGVVSTLTGASALGERGLRAATQFIPGTPPPGAPASAERLVPPEARIPVGPREKLGFTVEQIAEFFIPSGPIGRADVAITKGAAALPRGLQTLGRLAGRGALGAGVMGGQRALQKGRIDDDVKETAIIGAIFPAIGEAVGGVLRGVGRASKDASRKIVDSVIRPTGRDVKDGYKAANVFKHGLQGDLSEMAIKSNAKLNSLSDDLNRVLGSAKGQINLKELAKETGDDLLKRKGRTFGTNQSIKRVLGQLDDEILEVADDGLVDVLTANSVKRGAGSKGAWTFGSPDPDASAIETVYTNFYSKLKTAIEKASPKGSVAKINKDISEIIPISNAVIRRIPVAERNNLLSLTDTMGLYASTFDPKALILTGLQKISKVGRTAEVLDKIGEKLLAPSVSGVAQRFFGR